MTRNRGNGIDWMGLPMIAVVARLLCRELTLENEYLRLENRILKEKAQAAGRLRFTDEKRRSLTEATFSPHGPWMRQMGRNLLMASEDLGVAPRVVVHDRDGLLVHDLDVTLQSAGVEIVKTPFRAPDANAMPSAGCAA